MAETLAEGSSPSVNRLATPKESIGQRLRACREQPSLSLRELAGRLELSPSAVLKIKTGKYKPFTLESGARA
jgi:ribosome-binding protein aMBF1 (putative translation factor)